MEVGGALWCALRKRGAHRDRTEHGESQRILRRAAENTIRGRVVASPESGPWCVMWVQVSPWFVPTPNACRMTSNQLVLVLDAGSWPNNLISSYSNPRASNTTPLPLLVLETRSGTKFLTNSANPTLWTLFGSHKELGGASVEMLPTWSLSPCFKLMCRPKTNDITLQNDNESYFNHFHFFILTRSQLLERFKCEFKLKTMEE
jgi:hypothetical protein